MFSKRNKIEPINIILIVLFVVIVGVMIFKLQPKETKVVYDIQIIPYTINYGDTLSEISERVAVDNNVSYARAYEQVLNLNPYAEFGIRSGDNMLLPVFIKKEVINND